MEDFQLDIVIGKGPSARSIRLDLPRFTLVGATTRTGLITGPLRDRFGFVARLDYYDARRPRRDHRARRRHPRRAARGRRRARRSPAGPAGTPRIANRLLKRVRDYAEVRADGTVTTDDRARSRSRCSRSTSSASTRSTARSSRRCARRSRGQPVGLHTLAVAVAEEPDTVEDVYEPFLLKAGLLQRTPRGRVATAGGVRAPRPAAAPAPAPTRASFAD